MSGLIKTMIQEKKSSKQIYSTEPGRTKSGFYMLVKEERELCFFKPKLECTHPLCMTSWHSLGLPVPKHRHREQALWNMHGSRCFLHYSSAQDPNIQYHLGNSPFWLILIIHIIHGKKRHCRRRATFWRKDCIVCVCACVFFFSFLAFGWDVCEMRIIYFRDDFFLHIFSVSHHCAGNVKF